MLSSFLFFSIVNFLLRIYSQTRTSGAPCLLRRPFALSSPPDSLANPHLRCSLSASQSVCSFFSSGFTRKHAPPVLPVCFADRLLFLLLRFYSQTRTSGAPCLLRRPFALSSPPDLLANPHLRCSLSASQSVCSFFSSGFTRKHAPPVLLVCFADRLLVNKRKKTNNTFGVACFLFAFITLYHIAHSEIYKEYIIFSCVFRELHI